MKVVKSNRGQPAVSFISSILTIGFGILWTMMVHRFISIVGGFGPMGILFPLIGVFFITVGIIQATLFIKYITRHDFHTTDTDYFGRSGSNRFDFNFTGKFENISQKYWGDSKFDSKVELKVESKLISCKNCGESFDIIFSYCPKCGKCNDS